MTMSDPIADMLTRIRNASLARHSSCEMPFSKIKVSIAEVLRDEGYIDSFEERGEGQPGVGFGTRRIDGGGGGKGVARPGLPQQEQLGCSPVAIGRVLRRRRQRQAATVAWHRARCCPLATSRPRPERPG